MQIATTGSPLNSNFNKVYTTRELTGGCSFSGRLVPSKSIARVASSLPSCLSESPSAAVFVTVLIVISLYSESLGAEILLSRLPELDGHCSESLGAPLRLLWRAAP
jgi:hypothetical protein